MRAVCASVRAACVSEGVACRTGLAGVTGMTIERARGSCEARARAARAPHKSRQLQSRWTGCRVWINVSNLSPDAPPALKFLRLSIYHSAQFGVGWWDNKSLPCRYRCVVASVHNNNARSRHRRRAAAAAAQLSPFRLLTLTLTLTQRSVSNC